MYDISVYVLSLPSYSYYQATQIKTYLPLPQLYLIHPPTHTAAIYQYSYYPGTIKVWNQLPTSVTEIDNKETF